MIIQPSLRLNDVHEYYFSQKLEEIRQMNLAGHNVINLGIGNPDLSPSPSTIEQLIQSAKNPKNHGYQSYKAIPELRKAIADWYKKTYNVSLDREQEILPLLGSKEGIMHISMAFLNSEDVVLVPDPGYPTYSSVSKLSGAKIKFYNLDENNDWQPKMSELEKLASGTESSKLMWLNYPNMPTGAKANDILFESLIEFAHKHRILICHDNPYSMVLQDAPPKSILSFDGAKEVAIELNSLSKSHNMAGWRVGWVAGKKEYIDTILKVKSNVDSGMFLPIQHAAIEALQNSEDWHEKRNYEYKTRREKTWKLLDLLGCSYSKNQVGMFVWAKIPDNSLPLTDREEIISSEKFVEKILQEAKVFITPGFIFGKNGERFVRISLCGSQETIDAAIWRIENNMTL